MTSQTPAEKTAQPTHSVCVYAQSHPLAGHRVPADKHDEDHGDCHQITGTLPELAADALRLEIEGHEHRSPWLDNLAQALREYVRFHSEAVTRVAVWNAAREEYVCHDTREGPAQKHPWISDDGDNWTCTRTGAEPDSREFSEATIYLYGGPRNGETVRAA